MIPLKYLFENYSFKRSYMPTLSSDLRGFKNRIKRLKGKINLFKGVKNVQNIRSNISNT